MAGKQSEYTEAKGKEFCHRISEGRTVRSVCADKDMPVASTVYKWLETFPEFQLLYIRAKEIHADAIADEMLVIADTSNADNVCDEYGNIKPNHEWINRSRLRVDTRKWYLSKIMPKKYGDQLKLSGDSDNPVKIELFNKKPEEMTQAELDQFVELSTKGKE